MKQPALYIIASQRNGTLYTGITSDLVQRIYQHKHGLIDGFAKKYNCHIVVFYEPHETDGIGNPARKTNQRRLS